MPQTPARLSKAILAGITIVPAAAAAAPAISDAFASRFRVSPATPVGDLVGCTQIAIGPGNRLYATSFVAPMASYAIDPATGALTDRRAVGQTAFGLAFSSHAVPGSAESSYMYLARNQNYQGTISRLTDTDGDGVWGETAQGELSVDLVTGVPIGDHTLDQIQVSGNQLFVGIGARTNNGLTGNLTGLSFQDTKTGPVPGGFGDGTPGFTYGETSYNGAIATISDLSLVPNTANAAQLRDGPGGTSGNLLSGREAFLPGAPQATLPYTCTAPDKLVVHSAGTRNPYGLAIDSTGALWFTNNYGRANSNGDGTSIPQPQDFLDSDISNDVHDQLFRAVPGGDYRYDNANFRNAPEFPDIPVASVTFDNLDAGAANFGQLHDPAHPVGLGPSSSTNGLDFGFLDLTGTFRTGSREYALISRWTDSVAEAAPGTDTLTYRDILVVDPLTGDATRLADGFNNPIDVEADGTGGYYVADFGFGGTIYHITPRSTASHWAGGPGNWSTATQWSGPVPDQAGAMASFISTAGPPTSVTLDAPRTLGTLNFDSPATFVVAGSSTLTLDVEAGYAAIYSLAGVHEIGAPLHLADRTEIDVRQGTLRLSGPQSAAAGVSLIKRGAGTLVSNRLDVDILALAGGTTQFVLLQPASRTNLLGLTGGLTPTATLDLNDSAIVVDYPGSSPLPLLVAQIRHARNGGTWDATGITSSLAGATSGSSLGYAEAAALGMGNFQGIPLVGDALVIRYTVLGDATLDGRTDIDDFGRLAVQFNLPGEWFHGDFDYSGTVDIDDFSLLAANFNRALPAARAAAVPEASVAGVMASMPWLMSARRGNRARRR